MQVNPNIYVSQNYSQQPYANALADAEILHKAMVIKGTDEKTVSDLIVSRSRQQLQDIKKAFEQKFGKPLSKWIKDETSGNFEDLLLGLIDDKGEFDAKLVNHAIKGLGTNDDELIEVLCTRNNADLAAAKVAYARLFKTSMESDVKGDTSGDYETLLVTILKAERDEAAPANVDMAKVDAKALYDAGVGKIGTNERVFIEILTKRSFPHLYAINQCYSQLSGHSLEEAINKETSGNFRKALVTLITPRNEFFANQIHDAVDGLGTSDQKLVRNLVHLADDKYLAQAVNYAYMHKHKKNLDNVIGGDTSGWYGKTAKAVITSRVNL